MTPVDSINALSAVLVILFEMQEGITEAYPPAVEHIDEAMTIIGGVVNTLVLEEYAESGQFVPLPVFSKDESFNEESLVDDLGALVEYLRGPGSEHNIGQVEDAARRIEEAVSMIVLVERRKVRAEGTPQSPWSLLDLPNPED